MSSLNLKEIESIKSSYAYTQDDEIIKIYSENDRGEYTDETFEALKLIAKERNLNLPEQTPFSPKENNSDGSFDNEMTLIALTWAPAVILFLIFNFMRVRIELYVLVALAPWISKYFAQKWLSS